MDENNPEQTLAPEVAPTEPALPTLPPYVPPAPPPRQARSAAVAFILSFFPGAGQIYNGQLAKALFVFFAFAGSIYGVIEGAAIPFALCIPFVYFFNLIDAYRSAVIINERAAGGVPLPEEDTSESPLWGAALLAMGLLLLLNNMGWLRLAAVARFWPLALIVAGGVFLYQSVNRRKGGGAPGGRDAFLS